LQKDDNWKKHLEKMKEESKELQEAIEAILDSEDITKEQLEHIAEETLDIMEVGVGIFDKLKNQYNMNLRAASVEHIKKLASRGWRFKTVLRVEED